MHDGETDVSKLWDQFCTQRDQATREQLILRYAPLVKRVANRLGIVESATTERADLVSHGMAGLIEAVDRFDPARGVTFETFASQRIRGSILDAMRALDYLPRSVRHRAGEIERAIAHLQSATGQLPTDEDVANHLGLDIEAYRQLLGQVNIAFLSLDTPLGDLGAGGEDMVLGEALEDRSVRDTMTEIEERDLRLELFEAIRELPEREQLVLALYYYEELTVREVGEVMDLSPSRVSQLLARAVMILRARLIYDTDQPRGLSRSPRASDRARAPALARAA
jgi:RNA polymerase sigma factor for flagellar operon FliA